MAALTFDCFKVAVIRPRGVVSEQVGSCALHHRLPEPWSDER